MERVGTGIQELDEMIQGGFPKKASILVSGSPGTGKTILSLQFLMEGIENGEKGAYLSLGENLEDIIQQGEEFGWEIEEAIENDMLEVREVKPRNFGDEVCEYEIGNDQVERLVVDSITPVTDSKPEKARVILHDIITGIKDIGLTTLFISETGQDNQLSRDGVSEYVCDGVLRLNAKSMGSGMERTLNVVKLRSTDIDGGIHSLEISKNGITVE